MLNLACPTSPLWLKKALVAIDEVLLDHAHCEKKAASMAVNLIFRYPHREELLRPLARLAREELAHFEEVLDVLKERSIPFKRQDPSPYAGQLMEIVGRGEPDRLRDTLLVCAVIEARSCERMQLLAENLDDPRLVTLYKGLLASEARHHKDYLTLAEGLTGRADAQERLKEIAAHEVRVLERAPSVARMHT